jgi:hypothetical protein
LVSRLAAARGRIDALLDRLGDAPAAGAEPHSVMSEGNTRS